MGEYAAFLRGMNLGRRRITNQELAAAFTEIGFTQVRTFRASGNVAFEARGEPPEGLVARIESGLAGALGYAVPTFLRRAEEVCEIAAYAPFPPALVTGSAGKLQVGLLARDPGADGRDAALALSSERDRLSLGGRELYWLPDGGISESELDLKAVERALGPMTIRTMGTLEQMARKHFAD
ncbi:MAG TPA: DUF1697 domain-containing protein [Solirubrobacteraceae bacterium]|jgi:uncharacterized protein (DUF1697 family)|nr:DUF1697 domain-containing protein [Solirubrobacteraceae bacterium]